VSDIINPALQPKSCAELYHAWGFFEPPIAFSNEVDAGSLQENASKEKPMLAAAGFFGEIAALK
jgi:hypothetical protein